MDLFRRGRLPSQSSAFSTIGSGFIVPGTPYSVSSSILSYNRPMHNVGLQQSQRKILFSKVLKKNSQLRQRKATQKFPRRFKISTSYERKEKTVILSLVMEARFVDGQQKKGAKFHL